MSSTLQQEPFMRPKEKIQYESLEKEDMVNSIMEDLKGHLTYWSLKRTIKGELIKSKYSLNDVQDLIPKILEQNGLKVKIQNETYRAHMEAMNGRSQQQSDQPLLPTLDEPLDVVDQVRKSWALFLKDQIMSISHQLKTPLFTPKVKEDKQQIKTKKKKKGKRGKDTLMVSSPTPEPDPDEDLPKYTGVYGPSKLFETCVNIHNPNHERTFSTNIVGWGLIKLELKPLTMTQLQERFKELNPVHRQVGVDDTIKDWFCLDSITTAKKLSNGGYIPMITKLARTGLPLSQRAKIWKQLLHVHTGPKQRAYYNDLLKSFRGSLMLIDDMIINDVKRTCDDENYFPFEEAVLECMRAFSRDPYVYNNCSIKPVTLYGVDKLGKKRSCYPPNGIVPFEGLSLMLAPFCYLYNEPMEIYFIFREFYVRYFNQLNVISSQPQTLIPLCKQFEDMLQSLNPQLYYHLLELNIHPLDIAVNWIFHGFAGCLNITQLLLLWDRIIGFGDLNLLPVLSVAIFMFRAQFILQTTTPQEIFDVFSDFSTLEVIPLLQSFLFQMDS